MGNVRRHLGDLMGLDRQYDKIMHADRPRLISGRPDRHVGAPTVRSLKGQTPFTKSRQALSSLKEGDRKSCGSELKTQQPTHRTGAYNSYRKLA